MLAQFALQAGVHSAKPGQQNKARCTSKPQNLDV
jgi:hypothetical protein